MNYSRVDYAIHILQTAPKPRKFSLWVWADLTDRELRKFKPGDEIALNGCGTEGCAGGWIASDPLCEKTGYT